jgi:hypothetical protein
VVLQAAIHPAIVPAVLAAPRGASEACSNFMELQASVIADMPGGPGSFLAGVSIRDLHALARAYGGQRPRLTSRFYLVRIDATLLDVVERMFNYGALAEFSSLKAPLGTPQRPQTASKNLAHHVTVFAMNFSRVSVRHDTVPRAFPRDLLAFNQGQTRCKPGTQSFRSVSDR